MSVTAPVDVAFRTTGLPQVQAAIRGISTESGASADRVAVTSRRMSGAILEIARSGQVAGRGIKELIAGGAELALGFGAGGIVVGAVAILGAAIYEHITKGIQAARGEIRKFNEDLQALLKNHNLVGAGDLASTLYSGDRYAVQRDGENDKDFRNRQGGVLGIQQQIAAQRAIEAEGTRANGTRTAAAVTAYNEIFRLNQALAEYQKRAGQASAAVLELAGNEGEMAKAGADVHRYLEDQKPYFDRDYVKKNFARAFAGGVDGPAAYAARQQQLEFNRTHRSNGLNDSGDANQNPTVVLPKVPNLVGWDASLGKPMEKAFSNIGKLAGEGFVNTLADTIQTGMEAVFAKGANIGTVFGAIGKSALSGLGSVAIQIGKESLLTLGFMKSIKDAIAGWAPELGIAASIGLIALGSALLGAGGRVGANSGVSGGGSAGYGTNSVYGANGQIIDRGYIDPTRGANLAAGLSPRQAVVVNATIIGPNDPTAQRQIQELVRNAAVRGNAR